jgi:hypothetical protein
MSGGGKLPSSRKRINRFSSNAKKTWKEKPRPPEGAVDGPKRSPQHIGDGFAGHPSYEVEQVIAHRILDGKECFKVKWVGIPVVGNTWEPEAHFVGEAAKAKLAEFNAKRDKKRQQVRILFAPTACSRYLVGRVLSRSRVSDRLDAACCPACCICRLSSCDSSASSRRCISRCVFLL